MEDGAVLGKTFTKQGLGVLTGLAETELEPLLASLLLRSRFSSTAISGNTSWLIASSGLGVEGIVFPAAGTSEDVAMLLADPVLALIGLGVVRRRRG